MRDGEGLEELDRIAREIRGRVVEMSHRAKTPHLGSALSCVDILVAVYWATLRIDPRNPRDRERDRFILSKGHAVSALYAALAELDTEHIAPTAQTIELENILRDDVVKPGLGAEEILALAPERAGPYFVVPPILGEHGN